MSEERPGIPDRPIRDLSPEGLNRAIMQSDLGGRVNQRTGEPGRDPRLDNPLYFEIKFRVDKRLLGFVENYPVIEKVYPRNSDPYQALASATDPKDPRIAEKETTEEEMKRRTQERDARNGRITAIEDRFVLDRYGVIQGERRKVEIGDTEYEVIEEKAYPLQPRAVAVYKITDEGVTHRIRERLAIVDGEVTLRKVLTELQESSA